MIFWLYVKESLFVSNTRDAKQRSSGRIFLSYPHTHERFLYSGQEEISRIRVESKALLSIL